MGCLISLATMTVCVVALTVYLYTPLPDGISQRWKVQYFLAINNFVNLVAKVMAMLGMGNTLNCSRRLLNKMAAGRVKSKSDPSLEVRDTLFDGVKVRMYRPKTAHSPSPAVVYFHGGGWRLGNPDFVDSFASGFSKSANVVLVSVDYRLAPENPFPVPFQDCLAATLHLLKNSETFGVLRDKVVVMGDSAGGNMAAAVSLYLSNNPHLPQISLQILYYPCIQPIDFKLPSFVNPNNRALLPPSLMASFWSDYFGPTSHPNLAQAMVKNQHTSPSVKKSLYAKFLNPSLHLPKNFLGKVEPADLDSGDGALWKEIEDKALDPYMSPLIAEDVSKVAPAVIVTGEYDVLRDEGIMYAERLRKSGVKVIHRNYKMLHGFGIITRLFDISREVTNNVIIDLKKHLHLE